MAGLDPAIHVFAWNHEAKTWMPEAGQDKSSNFALGQRRKSWLGNDEAFGTTITLTPTFVP